MSGSEQERTTKSGAEEQSLRVAVAISLLRSKLLQKQQKQPPPPPVDQSDTLRWKRKAKERKQELLRLRQDLKEASDASQCDLFPQSASCKCYFFDNLGRLSPNKRLPDPSQCRFNDVLRRRFLRHVRFKERRRRTSSSSQRHHFADINSEDEMEQLRASVDFLVELCETNSPVEEANVANWSHQAADFILASLKNLLSVAMNVELIEGIISSLITRLVRRMCCPLQGNASKHSEPDAQFFVQHLIRKLGSEPYIGQRALFLVTQRISVLAENFLFADPFDDAFTNMHQCMFMLIQLTEFLVSDYLSEWSKDEGFDTMVFEEWVASMVHARKALQILESRNGVYVLYMERVIGELARDVGLNMSLHKLKRETLDSLLSHH
ncbi:protein MULTIPOLAR SPINDLE 1 isoform X1 [Prunus avium]|uniref:Protein MULTIPOLAR SPINDLE 1 isoform X1 n=1 Tax=Prunus avium TaxID=42229 RepID=A0A6P5SDL4_PRUAV|nr:protein MULTIPOLAR SPINDLE 1 isoform X1 [Prunus avium]